jgi:hypothetical protein
MTESDENTYYRYVHLRSLNTLDFEGKDTSMQISLFFFVNGSANDGSRRDHEIPRLRRLTPRRFVFVLCPQSGRVNVE